MAEEDQIELELDGVEEAEIEVDPPAPAEDPPVAEASEQDEFQKAESNTQKRIDRLTKKMREAQRREEEALRYAKSVQQEADELKNRFNNLDNSYVNEYESRVNTQMDQAEQALARAMEIGDTSAAVEANKRIASLAIENDRLAQAKMQQEARAQQAQQVQQPPQQPQQMRRPDARAEQWAQQNDWFGQDEAMTFAAFGIHKRLVESEGFDPASEEYYTELDRRISEKFNMPAKTTSKRPAQTVAGVSRTSGRSSGKKVRLTPSQVAIAKKLGVPLEAYAKHVKE
jgi:hypothetical protein